eukprot:1749426-Rhodomonas_salina.1
MDGRAVHSIPTEEHLEKLKKFIASNTTELTSVENYLDDSLTEVDVQLAESGVRGHACMLTGSSGCGVSRVRHVYLRFFPGQLTTDDGVCRCGTNSTTWLRSSMRLLSSAAPLISSPLKTRKSARSSQSFPCSPTSA